MFLSEAINPVLGIIENMAYFTPEELPNKCFGKEGAKLSRRFRSPILRRNTYCTIHTRREIVVLMQTASAVENIFDEVTNVVQETVNRNENLPAQRPLRLLQWQAVQQLKK
jgi:ATP-binding protein involved in chromosome partitioning